MEGKSQETAPAKAGMSVRSARKFQSGPLPVGDETGAWWRTRPDPFDGVWDTEIPLLRNDPTGKLKATTIIDWLAEQHPGRFSASQLLSNDDYRIGGAAWSGIQEVYFPQVHPPGREAQFDCGQGDHRRTVLPPPLFQLILSHSGWRYARGRQAGENIIVAQGLQNALWTLEAFQRWCAATIPRLPPELRSSRAALLTTITPPCSLWPPLHPHQSRPEP